MTIGYMHELHNARSGFSITELKQESCNGNLHAFCELCAFCVYHGGVTVEWNDVEEILGDVLDSILLNDYVDLFRHTLEVEINTSLPENHRLNLGGMVLDNYFSKLIKSNFNMENTFRIVKMLFLDQHEHTRNSYLKIHQGFLSNQLSFIQSKIKINQIHWILHQINIKINE